MGGDGGSGGSGDGGLDGDVEENTVYDIAYYKEAYPYLYETKVIGPEDMHLNSKITTVDEGLVVLSDLDVLFDWLEILIEASYACTDQWELDELYHYNYDYFTNLISAGLT